LSCFFLQMSIKNKRKNLWFVSLSLCSRNVKPPFNFFFALFTFMLFVCLVYSRAARAKFARCVLLLCMCILFGCCILTISAGFPSLFSPAPWVAHAPHQNPQNTTLTTPESNAADGRRAGLMNVFLFLSCFLEICLSLRLQLAT
jgi:hypothetical protein